MTRRKRPDPRPAFRLGLALLALAALLAWASRAPTETERVGLAARRVAEAGRAVEAWERDR